MRAREPQSHEEQSASERTIAVARALYDTRYRSQFDDDERRRRCFKRAVILSPSGITPDQVAELWTACQNDPKARDPERLFASLIDRGTWRQFLDRRASKRRHAAAEQRGAATRGRERADGPYGGSEPLHAASVRLPTLTILPRSSPA